MKLKHLLFIVLFLGASLPAFAEIILQNDGVSFVAHRQNNFLPLNGIVIVSHIPSASSSPQVAHHLQRAHGWSVQDNQNFETNTSLVYGRVSAARDRQSSVRANILRAQAFRLDLFK